MSFPRAMTRGWSTDAMQPGLQVTRTVTRHCCALLHMRSSERGPPGAAQPARPAVTASAATAAFAHRSIRASWRATALATIPGIFIAGLLDRDIGKPRLYARGVAQGGARAGVPIPPARAGTGLAFTGYGRARERAQASPSPAMAAPPAIRRSPR